MCVCVCCALVAVNNNLYKMQGTNINILIRLLCKFFSLWNECYLCSVTSAAHNLETNEIVHNVTVQPCDSTLHVCDLLAGTSPIYSFTLSSHTCSTTCLCSETFLLQYLELSIMSRPFFWARWKVFVTQKNLCEYI